MKSPTFSQFLCAFLGGLLVQSFGNWIRNTTHFSLEHLFGGLVAFSGFGVWISALFMLFTGQINPPGSTK